MGSAGIRAFLPLQAALPPGELWTESLEMQNLFLWRAAGPGERERGWNSCGVKG